MGALEDIVGGPPSTYGSGRTLETIVNSVSSKPAIIPSVKPKTTSSIVNVDKLFPKKKETVNDLLYKAKSTVRNITDTITAKLVPAKEKVATPKDTSISKVKSIKPIQLTPNQKRLTSDQLNEISPTKTPSAQITPKAKRESVKIPEKTSKLADTVNKALGPILGSIYLPQQYDPLFNEGRKPKDLTAGKVVGGAIQDIIGSRLNMAGGSVSFGRNVLKEGPNVVAALKSGAIFAGTSALISKLKEEDISMKDVLVSGGIGVLLGMGEPSVQIGTKKFELVKAKKTLKDFGFNENDFKSPSVLKSKFNKTVKTLHPDKGGDPEIFKQFVEAYNKATSAGIDPKWNLPDISTWIKSIWNRKSSDKAIIKTAETTKTKLAKLVQEKEKLGELKTNLQGEKNPQEVINTVMQSGLEKTTEGKALIKTALEAKNKGQNIVVQNFTPLDTEKMMGRPSWEEQNESLLESGLAKEAETKDTPRSQKARDELQKIEEDISLRRQENETKKSILEQFSGKQIQAMRAIKRSIAVRENKNMDPITVSSLPSYKDHIWDVMSAIGTNSEIEALRFIREDLPDPLTSATTREELEKIKVLKTHIVPKEVEVPRSQLPIGEGKLKVSRLEARMKKALGDLSQDEIEELGLSTFREMNKQDTIRKASEYVINNPDDALKVLMGEIEPPKGIIPEAIYTAMVNAATDDATLGTKLSSLTATALGQRISILTEIDPNSPVKILNEVYRIREEIFKKKYGERKRKDILSGKEKRLKETAKKHDKYDWDDFINSIDTC